MKILDRLAFIKAGYSKEEISKMIEEDTKAIEEGTEEKTTGTLTNDDFIKVISTLADEVKNIKDAIHKENISNTSITDDNKSDIDTILSSLINPYNNKEE